MTQGQALYLPLSPLRTWASSAPLSTADRVSWQEGRPTHQSLKGQFTPKNILLALLFTHLDCVGVRCWDFVDIGLRYICNFMKIMEPGLTWLVVLKELLKCFWKSQQQWLFPVIMACLLKIVHRPCWDQLITTPANCIFTQGEVCHHYIQNSKKLCSKELFPILLTDSKS